MGCSDRSGRVGGCRFDPRGCMERRWTLEAGHSAQSRREIGRIYERHLELTCLKHRTEVGGELRGKWRSKR